MSEPEPMVSVVIPAYNCEGYVREAIESVLAQTFDEFELIVVDDAATDGTAAVLAEYERAGRLCVVRHERNRGLSAARNSGIRAARGRYVTFLDADDVWRPEKLAYQAAILRRHPELALLGNAELNFADGSSYRFPPLPQDAALRPVTRGELLMGPCGLSPSNAIMGREVFDEVGLFDEELRAAEDRDMWLRVAGRFPAAVDDAVLNAYRLHGDNMSADPARMCVNKRRVLEKAFAEAPGTWPLRARARAHLHLDVAITCYEAGRRWAALRCLLRSLLAWPLPLRSRARPTPLVRLLWAGKALLGRRRFERLRAEPRPEGGQ